MSHTSFIIRVKLESIFALHHHFCTEIRAEIFKDHVDTTDIVEVIPEGYNIVHIYMVPCSPQFSDNGKIRKVIVTIKPEGNIVSGTPIIEDLSAISLSGSIVTFHESKEIRSRVPSARHGLWEGQYTGKYRICFDNNIWSK